MNNNVPKLIETLTTKEQFHLHHFARLYGFLDDQQDFGPRDRVPDLIVHTSEGDIGIEHTQLFVVEGGPGVKPPQAQETLQTKMLDRAKALARERSLSVSLVAYFSRKNLLSKQNIEQVAQRLVDVVAAMLIRSENPEIDTPLASWQYERQHPGEFPLEIEHIRFHAVDRPSLVMWGGGDGWAVPDITFDYLQEKIAGKDVKLDSYRSDCQKVWLVLVSEGVRSSYFTLTDEVVSQTFKTKFDEVFYFENLSGKIVKLNTVLPETLDGNGLFQGEL